jgi:two-component system cell cycle response regulator
MSAGDEFDVCRNILESLLTGVGVVDMQKKIVLWSDGAEHINGHLRHEVIGRSCVGKAVLHCQKPGCEFCSKECPLASAIKTAHPVEASGFLQHKSGYEVPVRIRAVPVHNPHGSIIGAVETFGELEQNDLHSTEKSLPGSVDEVTGVASRAQTKSHLREALAAFTERQVAFAVLRLQLQGLEHFRAAFGPDVASSLLRVVARSLASDLWRTDVVGRWADDEFLVILNGCSEESLPVVARTPAPHPGQRLHRVVGRTAFPAGFQRPRHAAGRRHHRINFGPRPEIARPGIAMACSCNRRGKKRIVRELAMFAIIGIGIVFRCIAAGYLMEPGSIRVLLQPAELLIIGGAAVGTVLISNPLHIIKKIIGGIGGVFGSPKFTQQT